MESVGFSIFLYLHPQSSILHPLMGKGDKRTKKGKIFRGSYGKRRPRKLKNKPKVAPKRA